MSLRASDPHPAVRQRRAGRPLSVLALLGVGVLIASATACSSDDDAAPPSTTTGIATTEPTSPTTTAPAGQPSNDLPGLWIVGPTGLTDEEATTWATAGPGETLRSPVSNPAGGVAFLRCAADAVTCKLEVVSDAGTPPRQLGDADDLLAAGKLGDRSVLLIGVTDPSVVASQADDRSQKVARLVDVENGAVTPISGWYGWESGPFVAAVATDRVIACFGEGETCSLSVGATPDRLTPLASAGDPATTVSVALSPDAGRATWLTTAPMTSTVTVHALDLGPADGGDPGTAPSTFDLRKNGSATPDDLLTDGSWVAVRTGTKVAFTQLATDGDVAPTGGFGSRDVPTGTTEVALRPSGGGGGGPGLAL